MNKAWVYDREMLRSWLGQPRQVYGLWFGKHCVWAAWLGLILALLSSPQGPGIRLCSFQAATGLPCPGCGLTRSLSCAVRGLFFESWNYHPLGMVILGLFLIIAAQSVCPRSFQESLARRMQQHARVAG